MATGTWLNGAWIEDDQIIHIYLQHITHNYAIFIKKLLFIFQTTIKQITFQLL